MEEDASAKEMRNSQGEDPRTFEENRQGGYLGTPKQSARERTQVPSKNQLKGGWFRRSGRKRSGRKKRRNRIRRKRVKYSRRSWWNKGKGRIASFITGKRNEEETKKGRTRSTDVPERDKFW